MKIKTIIVDDNKAILETLKKHLRAIDYVDLVYSTLDSEDFLEVTLEQKPDLVIMDIDMPRLTGIELGKILREKLPYLEIVYVTAHGEYMHSAFEVYASDFLEKPYDAKRLLQTLERLKNKLNIVEKTYEVKTQKTLRHIRVSEIVCIEACKRKALVNTSHDSFEVDQTFNDFVDMLDTDLIYKSARSYAVNMTKVKSIEPFSRTSYEVTFFKSEATALLSKNNYEAFRQKLKELTP